jgi:hypothetical protein
VEFKFKKIKKYYFNIFKKQYLKNDRYLSKQKYFPFSGPEYGVITEYSSVIKDAKDASLVD